ncbi:MAG: rhomboid family intramembrane serine protease [Parvibaculum sp.]|uniref:rhomboid family intramembrane serine protease n=1 Tax=Parvibaculum sp. TaxID=2024848 RepID=UPI0027165BF4|nr:rhomboid family intramembrane serine protease [Parvibaculum sp.]MDO8839574.1 rhomboid family intramembrane serine protease [Parvibaculum sp.]
MDDPRPGEVQPFREPPAFNVPGAVLALLVAIVGLHLLIEWLPAAAQRDVLFFFALFPLRYEGVVEGLPGGLGAALWTPITYTFLHGGWTHLIVNSVWLLAFGSPIARRFGALRFFLFYFLCGAAGAFLHVTIYPASPMPVVGASAAISGLMGGAARFVFLGDGPLGALGGGQGSGGAPRRSAGILASLTDRRTLIFVGVWIGLNYLFGATALSGALGVTAQVAWEAHLGGFLAGLLLFGLFDPIRYSPSGGPGNVDYGEWLGKDREK